ncbi:hypothetical protein CRG98_010828 [Punica granatum]|uniref:Uncharacterized protein n=1 Tax=Punica granatum TaxID=22663 RepID=A0A2I0KJV9_PUNGR|nr:hypothetical protein CRG98_010828 [Punica granatum]
MISEVRGLFFPAALRAVQDELQLACEQARFKFPSWNWTLTGVWSFRSHFGGTLRRTFFSNIMLRTAGDYAGLQWRIGHSTPSRHLQEPSSSVDESSR